MFGVLRSFQQNRGSLEGGPRFRIRRLQRSLQVAVQTRGLEQKVRSQEVQVLANDLVPGRLESPGQDRQSAVGLVGQADRGGKAQGNVHGLSEPPEPLGATSS